jgi:mannose-6-phosphate isomerase-like protein (cupin superfamily)
LRAWQDYPTGRCEIAAVDFAVNREHAVPGEIRRRSGHVRRICGATIFVHQEAMMRMCAAVTVLFVLSGVAQAQPPAGSQPAPTDRTKASHMSAAALNAALAKLPADRPAGSVRVFSLAPYNVNVERRQAQPQGASIHEAQAELFYVVDGSATLLTGGKLVGETRNGTNLQGKSIEGGTGQKFGKGDFMVVPSGVAHQFVDIQGPLVLMSLYLPDAK